jgi:hypothetical protein
MSGFDPWRTLPVAFNDPIHVDWHVWELGSFWVSSNAPMLFSWVQQQDVLLASAVRKGSCLTVDLGKVPL